MSILSWWRFGHPLHRKTRRPRAQGGHGPRAALALERLETRLLPAPVLSLNSTVAVAVVNGSTDVVTGGGQLIALTGGGGNSAGPVTAGIPLTNGGTWADTTPGATVTLTPETGLTQNADGSWSWSGTTPARPGPVTITATDSLGSSTSIQFWLAVNNVYQVTTIQDVDAQNNPVPGSLRQAILSANSDASPNPLPPDLIAFNINASGVQTIQPQSPLPTINNSVFIDGYTQPGSSPNTRPVKGSNAGDNAVQTITLDGSYSGTQADGLTIAVAGSTVEGLVIQNFYSGIHLTTNGNDTIAGNYLTNNSNTDILVENVPNNTIGGTAPAARNECQDVTILGAGATGNVLEGNYIGTDGNQVLPRPISASTIQNAAVLILGASNNTVGGTACGAGNVIGAGLIPGGYNPHTIVIQGGGDYNGISYSSSSGNVVQGNYIGVNAAGTAVLTGMDTSTSNGPGVIGIALGHCSDTIIGGTTSSAGNVIAGWLGWEVTSDLFQGATGTVVEGNFIGTNAAGSAGLGPTAYDDFWPIGIGAGPNAVIRDNVISGLTTAVVLDGDDQLQGNLIGTDATGTQPIPNAIGVTLGYSDLIGGTTPGAGNIIAFNDGPGVAPPPNVLGAYPNNPMRR